MSRPFNRVIMNTYRFVRYRKKKISKEMITINEIVKKEIIIVEKNHHYFNHKKKKLISLILMHLKIIKIIIPNLNPKHHLDLNLIFLKEKDKEINYLYLIVKVIKLKLLIIIIVKHQNRLPKCLGRKENLILEEIENKC